MSKYIKHVRLQLEEQDWAKTAKQCGGYAAYLSSLPFEAELAATAILTGDKKFLAKVTAAVAAQQACPQEDVTLTIRRLHEPNSWGLVAATRRKGRLIGYDWLFSIFALTYYSPALAIGIISAPLAQRAGAAAHQYDVLISGISTLAQAVVIAKRELLAVIDSWNAQEEQDQQEELFNDAEDML